MTICFCSSSTYRLSKCRKMERWKDGKNGLLMSRHINIQACLIQACLLIKTLVKFLFKSYTGMSTQGYFTEADRIDHHKQQIICFYYRLPKHRYCTCLSFGWIDNYVLIRVVIYKVKHHYLLMLHCR